jgi:hypothetical protein
MEDEYPRHRGAQHQNPSKPDVTLGGYIHRAGAIPQKAGASTTMNSIWKFSLQMSVPSTRSESLPSMKLLHNNHIKIW